MAKAATFADGVARIGSGDGCECEDEAGCGFVTTTCFKEVETGGRMALTQRSGLCRQWHR